MSTMRDLSIELVECILAHLSMRDLLLAQRVCRDWRDIIKTSPQLQRNTFLGFVPGITSSSAQLARYVLDNSKCASIRHDPHRWQRHPDKTDSIEQLPIDEPEKEFLARFNPVFPSEGDIIRTNTKQFREPLDSPRSWLDMYITSPPCNHAEVTVFFRQPSHLSLRRLTRRASDTGTAAVTVNRSRGVRARDVLQEVYNAHVAKTRKWQRMDISVPGIARV